MLLFLSYAHKDSDKADQLSALLKAGGHDVWTDQKIRIGDNWQARLAQAIQDADAIVLAITEGWLASPFCNWEFITAAEASKQVLPFILQAGLKLPHRLARFQYTDFSDGFENDTQKQKLLDDLAQLALTPADVDGRDKAVYERLAPTWQMSISGGTGNTQVGGDQITNTITDTTIDKSQVVMGKQESVNITQNTATGETRTGVLEDLEILFKSLEEALANVPPEQRADADFVRAQAQLAQAQAQADQPSRRRLQITGDSLKAAAENLLSVAPIVAEIAAKLLRLA